VIINFPPSHRSLAVEASGLTERIRHPGNQKVSQHARPDEANFIGGNWLTPDKADKADKADNERLDFPFFPLLRRDLRSGDNRPHDNSHITHLLQHNPVLARVYGDVKRDICPASSLS